jgi:hypothetical protein
MASSGVALGSGFKALRCWRTVLLRFPLSSYRSAALGLAGSLYYYILKMVNEKGNSYNFNSDPITPIKAFRCPYL